MFDVTTSNLMAVGANVGPFLIDDNTQPCLSCTFCLLL